MSALDPYLGELAERGYREGDAPRFLAAWERLEAAYFARLDELADPAAAWPDRFCAAAAETVRLVEEFPVAARFLVLDATTAGQLGRERQRRLVARLAGRLDRAREELQDPARVPEQTGTWVVGVFLERIRRRCGEGAAADLGSQLPELCFLGVSAYFGVEAGREAAGLGS